MTREGDFRTTRWSLILSARDRDVPGSREALASLCETYWYPLYVYSRRRGHDADDARDLTQGFFLQLLEKDSLRHVRPEAGRFRSFLLASLKHFLANQRRDAQRLKRGGDRVFVTLDAEAAEIRYRAEPRSDDTPDKAYDRQWAVAVLDRAHETLEREFIESGKQDQYRLLSGFLPGDDPRGSYGELARQLDSTEAAVKMAVSRMRRRFGRIVREEIARTVGDDATVDEELRYLLSIVERL